MPRRSSGSICGRHFSLIAHDGRDFGTASIETVEDDWYYGKLSPSPAFVNVRPLFNELNALVNDQVLILVDEAEQPIQELRLCLKEKSSSWEITSIFINADDSLAIKVRQ